MFTPYDPKNPKPVVLDGKDVFPVFSPICITCQHWNPTLEKHRSCKAFPDSIPDVIWSGKNDHKQPFKGDNGVLYEQRS